MKSRIEDFDICKGITILIVVFHHISFQAHIVGINEGCIQHNLSLLPFYGSWFMPIFFFTTGYCSNYQKSFSTFLCDNVSTLIWPSITFSMLNAGILSLSYLSMHPFINMMEAFPILGFNWFLTTLFFAKLIMWTLRRIRNRYLFLVCCSLFILGIVCNDANFLGRNWFHYRHTIYLFGFMALGNIIKEESAYKKFIKYGPYGAVLYIFLLIVCHVQQIEVPGIAGVWINFNLKSIPLHLLLSLSGLLSILWVSNNVKKIMISKALAFLGQNSLIIYLTHSWLLNIAIRYIYHHSFQPKTLIDSFLFSVLVFLIVVIACSILINIFSRHPFSISVRFPQKRDMKV